MNENVKRILIGLIVAVIFVVCVALIVIGQRNVGPQGLLMMLVGLAGLIILLWMYNRQYK